MSKYQLYIGTTTKAESEGIYKVIFDSVKGTLENVSLFYEVDEPKFLNVYKGFLASTCAQNEQAGLVLLDVHQPYAYHLDTSMVEHVPATYIVQDDSYVYTVNYHEDSFLIYSKSQDKLHVAHRINLGNNVKAHQILMYEGLVLVVCLGVHRIKLYDKEHDFAFVKDIVLPEGSGPRQAVMDKNQQFLYVLSELSNEVFIYKISAHNTFRCQQICSVLPGGTKGECFSAALRLSENGKFLYTSTRGCDIISSFEIMNGILKQKEFVFCGGEHPRDFILDPTGRWMIVANRDSNNLVVFKIDSDSGEILEISDEQWVPNGVCLSF